jgi:hypothetical protein
VVLAFGILQLIPVERTNPPVEEIVDAPPAAMGVLRRACWDCHSNETVWPWYAWVAPVSWTVANDVEVARSKLNLTTWNRYDGRRRAHLVREIVEEVDEGAMPLPIYLGMHPQAELTPDDREKLRAWAATVRADGGP